MLPNRFAVQLTYASVDRGDGSDPREDAVALLRSLRVPAALRDATAEWGEQQEAVLVIPVTEDGRVVTLTERDAIDAVLTAAELRTAFADAGLTLWLDVDGEAAADELPSSPDDEQIEADAAEIDPALFEPSVVRVASFSHRGPASARIIAQLQRVEVDHLESGIWSLQRFSTSEPSVGLASGAELPVVELTRAEDGGWFDVTVETGVVPFWPDAERDTALVISLDDIAVAETAEIIRRLHSEGDGSRDELEVIAGSTSLDVDAAHAALRAEVLGGVQGARARQRAFLAAFGIPAALIDEAFDDAGVHLPVQRMRPVGWWALVRDLATEGMGGFTPLTRRDRPLARFVAAVRKRPLLGAALSTAELAAGALLARRPGVARTFGILVVIDAAIDLLLLVSRIRRSR